MKTLVGTELERLASLPSLLAGSDVADAVHRTRTGIKRLRAFLRLARRSIGTSTYQTENAALRDTARLLAPVRDAFVVIETATAHGAEPTVLDVLSDDYATVMDGFDRTTRRQTLDRLGAIAARWHYLMWESPGHRSIGSGLERTYRKGLVEFETVLAAPTDRAFHGWRRRVKYLRYQFESLEAPEGTTVPFRLLGDDLGAEHDQTVLISVADRHLAVTGFENVARRSRLTREELRHRSVRAGRELFSAQPESFRHAVEAVLRLG
jgi:CHAD domain-containing protein